MSQISPRLLQDTLVYEQQGQAQSLRVEREEWYSCL